jgi:hypothetical protein
MTRPILWTLAVAVTSAMVILWAASLVSDARDRAGRSAADLAASVAAGDRITAERKSTGTDATTRPEGAIDRALAEANIPPDRRFGDTPQPARPLADGNRVEHATQLSLRQVTLRQTLDLITAATRAGLIVRDVRLAAPAEEQAAETTAERVWDATLVVATVTTDGQTGR